MINLTFGVNAFIGNARAGKTLSMIREGEQDLLKINEVLYMLKLKIKKGYDLTELEKKRYKIFSDIEVMSNIKLNKNIFGNYKLISVTDLLEMYKKDIPIKNKLILFDDIFKNIDSRLSGSEQNRILSYFITEIGKGRNIMKYVSHFKNRVDLRLRDFTETFTLCQKGRYYELNLGNGKMLIWLEDENYYQMEETEKEQKEMIIKQTTFKEYINYTELYDIERTKTILDINFIKAYDYFNHYDTEEIV